MVANVLGQHGLYGDKPPGQVALVSNAPPKKNSTSLGEKVPTYLATVADYLFALLARHTLR